MYNKVVVPLDGSKLAETALPHLEEIARGCSIPEVLLVSVTEKISGGISPDQAFEKFVPESPTAETPPQIGTSLGVVYSSAVSGGRKIPMTLGKMARTASEYLCCIAEDLEKKGFNVTATVAMGNPAEEIIRFIEKQKADLVIMASRGKSGFSRWEMGNIAEKVIRVATIPVLLIKPPPGFKETKPRRRGVAL
jgi:nucleotide-binding universal stress UspA family protein